jgi:oligosaccharide repeat unit polymerase
MVSSPPPLYPALGLAGTLVGTLGAIATLPASGTPGGADMVLPAAILAGGLLMAPIVACLNDLKAPLRLEYLLPLSLVYWLLLDPIQGDSYYPGLERDDIIAGFWAVGMFAFGGYVACAISRWRPPRVYARSATVDLHPSLLIRIILLCFALGLFKYIYAVGFDPIALIKYAGVSRWSAPWSAGRLGGWGALLDHLPYFGYLVPVLTVTLAGRIGWLKPSTVMAILMSLLLFVLLAQGGGRRVVGVMAGAPLITWILAQPRIDLRRAVVIVIAVIAILGFMELMLEYRNRGLGAVLGTEKIVLNVGRINIDDNFYRLSQVINIIPDKHDYVYHRHLYFTLVRPIPRALWPGKPVDGGFDLAQFIGAKGLSLSSTVLAEWYMSGGFFLIAVGGFIYGVFACTFGRLWYATGFGAGRMLYGISAMTLFAGVRSMPDLILMSYILLAWLPVWWFLVRRHSK